VIGKLLRAVVEAVSTSTAEASSNDESALTRHRLRCECGAHSRGGWGIEFDARYNAERHQWRQGVGHPMPEVYSIEQS
jgi:hypothetical protein